LAEARARRAFHIHGFNNCLRYALEAQKKRPKTIPTTTFSAPLLKKHSKLRTYNKTLYQESSDKIHRTAGTRGRPDQGFQHASKIMERQSIEPTILGYPRDGRR